MIKTKQYLHVISFVIIIFFTKILNGINLETSFPIGLELKNQNNNKKFSNSFELNRFSIVDTELENRKNIYLEEGINLKFKQDLYGLIPGLYIEMQTFFRIIADISSNIPNSLFNNYLILGYEIINNKKLHFNIFSGFANIYYESLSRLCPTVGIELKYLLIGNDKHNLKLISEFDYCYFKSINEHRLVTTVINTSNTYKDSITMTNLELNISQRNAFSSTFGFIYNYNGFFYEIGTTTNFKEKKTLSSSDSSIKRMNNKDIYITEEKYRNKIKHKIYNNIGYVFRRQKNISFLISFGAGCELNRKSWSLNLKTGIKF